MIIDIYFSSVWKEKLILKIITYLAWTMMTMIQWFKNKTSLFPAAVERHFYMEFFFSLQIAKYETSACVQISPQWLRDIPP